VEASSDAHPKMG